ncbi:hypothetical protein MPTK1_5g18720 [Marchantia polymorpha subsp. ruderalis]|uniref:Uncharacterized protein n=2 Tax=Marchantia polymorpha TaxID=3197 RepID=A0AAF6BJU7_MARPO|nr:hypothetical protein MARPO_0073s0068 [Marchantia polymorpha]BBN12281.1 hypothetical protein Mp_5g18720 [Marchantia polymorpha subsp. ruderalis]|eukprot:PTQ35194.1 hypothetical protein MARPO_0073s0068 [Marchantia polymorpha]
MCTCSPSICARFRRRQISKWTRVIDHPRISEIISVFHARSEEDDSNVEIHREICARGHARPNRFQSSTCTGTLLVVSMVGLVRKAQIHKPPSRTRRQFTLPTRVTAPPWDLEILSVGRHEE